MKRLNKISRKVRMNSVIAMSAALVVLGLFTISVPPVSLNGGAIWYKNGMHYMSNGQVKGRVAQINEPYESAIAQKINAATPNCDAVTEGFCLQSSGVYVQKILVTPAVEYVPGTPDTQQLIGYCTLCRDNTFSPSCAVGRGACSWHGGPAAYNVARYRTIPGKPAVEAVSAVYSYTPKTYKASELYTPPKAPSLGVVTSYAK